jgi:hypothetical protein
MYRYAFLALIDRALAVFGMDSFNKGPMQFEAEAMITEVVILCKRFYEIEMLLLYGFGIAFFIAYMCF